MSSGYATQNTLLLNKLLEWYKNNNNLERILNIINGEGKVSLRIIDWFVTNYAKKNYTVIDLPYVTEKNVERIRRFKVYIDYKLKLKAYSKKRFDPFCRWERINIPYKEDSYIQTTIGQLNFFKWAIENKILDYIEENYATIERDMNSRNSTAKRKINGEQNKTRKKREELSVSAVKSIKKETVEIVIKFD